METKKLSVVIPAHNEAEGIEHAIVTIAGYLQAIDGIEYEIIVVDDGSRDATFATVKACTEKYPNIQGLKLSRNFGKEGAMLAGLEAAQGDAVVTMDSDLQHPPSVIADMVERWRNGAEIVHAVKAHREHDTRMQRARAHIFNTLVSKFGGIDLQNSSDFKLIDRRVLDVLINDIVEKERFYRGLASWVGFRQESISFHVQPRAIGESAWSLKGLIVLALSATVSFTSAPLRIVMFLGLATLLLAVGITIETLWSLYNGTAVSGFATLIIAQLIVGSFIMISLGIVGEYISRIYIEQKGRPSYIVAESVKSNTD